MLSSSPLVITQGKSVRSPKRIITTLSLDKKHRDTFFSDKNSTLSLLKRQPLNPLLEEGKFETADNRERNGEYFISPEGLAILLVNDIKKYSAKKTKTITVVDEEFESKLMLSMMLIETFFPLLREFRETKKIPKEVEAKYNTQNIFIVDNNFEKLCELFATLKLKVDEDAKILVINAVHAIPLYLRNINGEIKCFIPDSSGNTLEQKYIRELLQCLIDKVDIVIGPFLQKDYYSCFTFARQAMRYFIKHGDEIFPHIGRVTTTPNKEGFKELSVDNLMPCLLKFSQVDTSLSRRTLNTTVSQKKQTTLHNYFKENQQKFSGKLFQTAAIKKRYRYLSEINETLAQLHVEEIKPTLDTPLPTSVQDYIRPYYTGPQKISVGDACLKIQAHAIDPTQPVSPYLLATYRLLLKKEPALQKVLSTPLSSYSSQEKTLYNMFVVYALLSGCDLMEYADNGFAYSQVKKFLELAKNFPNPCESVINAFVQYQAVNLSEYILRYKELFKALDFIESSLTPPESKEEAKEKPFLK